MHGCVDDDHEQLLATVAITALVSLAPLTAWCADSERWQAMLDQDQSGALLLNKLVHCMLVTHVCAHDKFPLMVVPGGRRHQHMRIFSGPTTATKHGPVLQVVGYADGRPASPTPLPPEPPLDAAAAAGIRAAQGQALARPAGSRPIFCGQRLPAAAVQVHWECSASQALPAGHALQPCWGLQLHV